jgi:urease accessory protein
VLLSPADNSQIFAANRASGHIALDVAAAGGVTRRRQVHEEGSLRVRFPHSEHAGLEAVIVNSAGGMAGGDRFGISLSVGEGASLIAGTAAAEKVYRSVGPASEVTLNLAVSEGGRLAWLPQETILFDQARLGRRIDIELAESAALVLAEALVFGRAAMGEAVEQGLLADRWRLRRGGRLVFAEGVRLDGAIAERLRRPAVAGGGIAIATVVVAPGSEATLTAVRALEAQFAGEVGISAWNGIAVARLCAKDGAALRHDLIALLTALKQPLPRLWTH